MIDVARIRDGKVGITTSAEELVSFLGQKPGDEEQLEWCTKAYRGFVQSAPKLEEGQTRPPQRADVALRVAACFTRYVPVSTARVTFLVGSSALCPDVGAASSSVMSQGNMVVSMLDCNPAAPEDVFEEDHNAWREAAKELGGGDYRHNGAPERFGQFLRSMVETWCTRSLVPSPVPDTQSWQRRKAVGGARFSPHESDTSLAIIKDWDPLPLEMSDRMRKAQEKSAARALAIPQRGGKVFFGLPIKLGREGEDILVWREDEAADSIVGKSSVDVMPGCKVTPGLENKLPVFVDFDQFANYYERSRILARLSSIAGLEDSADISAPLRVYMPIIQRHVMHYVLGETNLFCGIPALKQMIFSVIIATPQESMGKMMQIGYHPQVRKFPADFIKGLSQCWLAIGTVAACYACPEVFVKVVTNQRDGFIRKHTRDLLAQRKRGRAVFLAPTADPDETRAQAQAMKARLEAKGVRKTVEQCERDIFARRKKEHEKAKRQRSVDPVHQEEERLMEDIDKREVSKQIQEIIDGGFAGIDIGIKMEDMRKIDAWRLSFVPTVLERVTKYAALDNQVSRARRGSAVGIRSALATLRRNFDEMFFVCTVSAAGGSA